MMLEAPWALGLLAAVPAIVLLWVLRPRRPRVRVPSLLLWPGSPAARQAARPWQRLRNHPLLWLQALAATLLALAAARPFVPASAAGRHLVVLLDASGSMRAREATPGASGLGTGGGVSSGTGPPDRFAAAHAAVLDLARGLGPGQELTLIRVDEQPRVLVAGARSAAEVEGALAGEAPSFGPADGAAALALAAGLTRGAAEWVLVGDGGMAFGEAARRPAGTGLRAIAIGRAAANAAVTGLAIREGPDGVTLQAGVRNTGKGRVAGRLQLLAEGQLVGVREWQLDPGAETYVHWEVPPAPAAAAGGPRWYEARLAGVDPADNALEHDDRAWAAVPAPGQPAVLLVSAGNTFLERALAVHGQVRAFRAAPADWAGLAASTASGTSNTLRPTSPPAASAREGGRDGQPGRSIPAAPGAAPTAYPLTVLDRLWPQTLPEGSVLLVGPPVGEEFRPQAIFPSTDHPLLRHVDWSDVRIAAARRVPLDAGWETVIGSDGGPLLAIRTAGRSRQALLTFELSQSDLPLRPAFPILLANVLDWLLPRPDTAPRAAPPGSAIAVEPAPLAQRVWAEAIGGTEDGRPTTGDRRPSTRRLTEGIAGFPATDDAAVVGRPPSVVGQSGAGSGGRYELAPPWPPLPFRPPAPGLYRIVQTGEGDEANADGRQERLVVADGYHPQEADVTPRAPDLPAAEGAAPEQVRRATAFWPWLAAAVLALSTAEWWVDARGR